MIRKKFIMGVAVISIIYTGCNDKQTTSSEEQIVQAKTETTVDKVTSNLIEKVESTAKKVEELAKDVQKSTAPVVQDISKKVKEVEKTISQTTVEDIQTKIKEVSAPVINAVSNAVTTPNVTNLYKKCAGCHGAKAEKVALGKSKVIKGWEAVKIADALKGYKSGTYGGVMKGLMKSQVGSMSNKEIDALSMYIATF
jgi:cytochrome c553